jgi:lysophospholipase L1-like esterase
VLTAKTNTQTFFAGLGAVLTPGGTAAGSFTFTDVDVEGFYSLAGGVPTWFPPSRVLADGVDITRTLLTATQAAFAVSGTAWANNANSTPTHSTDSGEDVLVLTSVAAGGMSARIPTGTGGVPCSPGQAVFVTGEWKATAATQNVQMSVRFYDSGGVQIGSEVFSPNIADTTSGWTMSAYLATAPASTVYATLFARVASTAGAGEVHTVRRARLIPVTTLPGSGNGILWRFQTAASLANAAHALTLEAAPNVAPGAGGSAVGLSSVTLRTGSAGFRVSRIAKPGVTSFQAASADQAAGTQTNALVATVDLRQPHLAVIMLTANDIGTQATNGITPAQTVANITTIASRVITNGGCVLLVTDPNYPTAQTPNAQADYFAALKAYAAATDHVAYVDINAVWGTEAQAETAGLMNYATYGIHPTLNGHGDIARIVDRTLFADRGVTYLV